ncbi:MAG TPA: LCP family protein [Streptosporangiaceae bacterium]
MGNGDDQLVARGNAPRGRRAPRLLGWLAAVVAVVLVGGALTAYAVYRDVFGKIGQVKVTGLGHRPRSYDNALNILVIGSDTRRGKNARFGKHVAGQRSDTIMILHLSPGLRRAVVLSIPRDSVVPVLACPREQGSPGQVAQPGQIEQINETFSNGGPGCLWKTIEHTTHIRLDHFAELNFTGFESVINDLGGVRICLPFPISDRRSKLHLTAGIHHVGGAEALAYWRVRYIGAGSDLERIQRDQFLMASVAQKVKHTGLLSDPTKIFRIVRDIAASLTTDSGLRQSDMIALVQRLRTMPLRAVHFVQVPVVSYAPNPNWVQWPGQASALFTAIAHDKKLPRSARHHARQRHRQAGGGVAATRSHGARSPASRPGAAGTSANPAGNGQPARSPLSGVTKRYGGITAGTGVCGDKAAFAGPLGGH